MSLRKSFLPSLLVLLLLPLVAAGQVSINSKANFAPYTFAEFQAVVPEGWSCDWEFPDKVQCLVLDDVGKKLVAVGPPGEYTARLTAVGPSGNDKVPFLIKKAVKSFTIEKGDNPEPDPGPTPEPDDKPKAKSLYIVVWRDKTLTPAQARVVNDRSWQSAIETKHRWKSESVGGGVDEEVGIKPFLDKVGSLPAVTIQDAITGRVLNQFALPDSSEALLAKIKASEAK